VDELFKLMQLFVKTYPDTTEQEMNEIRAFRRQTLQLYIQVSVWRTNVEPVTVLHTVSRRKIGCSLFSGFSCFSIRMANETENSRFNCEAKLSSFLSCYPLKIQNSCARKMYTSRAGRSKCPGIQMNVIWV